MATNTDPPKPCKVGPCGYHCNCFNDIDWGRDGCQWCQIIGENTKLNESLVEANQKLDIAQKGAESMMLQRNSALERVSDLAAEAGKYNERLQVVLLQLGAIHNIVDGLNCAHEFGKKCLTCDIKAAFAEKPK